MDLNIHTSVISNKLELLIGKTIIDIKLYLENDDGKICKRDHGEYMVFTTDKQEEYILYHKTDCCDYAYLEDIIGDINDITGSPIIKAEELHSETRPDGFPEREDEFNWFFYNIGTQKGSITLRWCESNNGYYAIEMSFEKYNNDDSLKDLEYKKLTK